MEYLYTQELKTGVPLVNHIDINEHVGKVVMIIGKVESFNNNTIFLDCGSDSTKIQVKYCKEQLKKQSYVGVIGQVEHDGSVTCKDVFTEGLENFDFQENLNKLLELYRNKKDIAAFV